MSGLVSMPSRSVPKSVPKQTTIADNEAALLGALIQTPELVSAVTDAVPLTDRDFSTARFGLVFKTLVEKVRSGEPVDPVLLAGDLQGQFNLSELLALCDLEIPSAPACIEHARRIRRHSLLCRFKAAANDFLRRPNSDTIRTVQEVLAEISAVRSGPVSAADAADRLLENLRNPAAGLSYGFSDLDLWTGGMKPQEVIILAGRPSMGKSSLATQIAVQLARDGKVVLFVSLEVAVVQVMLKALALLSGRSPSDIRQGRVSEIELAGHLDQLRGMRLWIDERGAHKPSTIRSAAVGLKNSHGLDLVIIDHLQLLRGDASRYGNQTEELADISRSFKSMANELAVPILVLSQLSREVENRADKRPALSDLRGSGALEQDSDVVLFLYREKYYRRDADDTTEIILAKQRHGPTGVAKAIFDPTTTAFYEI